MFFRIMFRPGFGGSIDVRYLKLNYMRIIFVGTDFFLLFQFLEFGKTATEAESFSFLSKEIPVRLSNIMKEINLLPGNLLQMPSLLILKVSCF